MPTVTRIRVGLLLGLILAAPSTTMAQVIEGPSRAFRGLFGGRPTDPNRTRQELTLTANATSGYDQNLNPGGGDPTDVLRQREGGYTIFADAGLQYFRGRAARSIEAEGRVYLTSYSGLGTGPAYGGTGRVAGMLTIGRRGRLELGQQVRYEPFFSFGAFAPLRDDVEVSSIPETDPTSGFSEERSWTMQTSASMGQRWNWRHLTTLDYGYSNRNYIGAFGHDSVSHSGGLSHDWSFNRQVSILTGYRFSDSVFTDVGAQQRPLQEHGIDVSLQFQRNLSATRRFSFSLGGGAAHVSTLATLTRRPIEYWAPAGQGSVRVDIERSWSIWADYRRGLTVLDGIALQSFFTDAALVRIGGLVGRRFDVAAIIGYSNGRAGDQEGGGRYESYAFTGQLSYAFSRCCSTVVNYYYYDYRLTGVLGLPIEFPSRFDRNAVRAGISMWLPLFGSFGDSGGGRSQAGSRQ
jgi:hypothetical protein